MKTILSIAMFIIALPVVAVIIGVAIVVEGMNRTNYN